MTNTVDQWYLNRYGREPLLTVREELILSRQVHEGKAPDATPRQRQIADRARQRMIRGNMRLAVNVAMKYMSRCRSMELSDLVQEALIGLDTAVERFDYTRGYKFSTFAYWWIRQGITRAIVSRDTMIRVPQHSHDDYVRVKSAIVSAAAVGEFLTLEQAAARVGVKIESVRLAVRAETVASLNCVTSQESDSELIDLIAYQPPDASEDLPLYRSEIRAYLSTEWLSEVEVDVLTQRYGLDDGEPKTLKSIGDRRGISRERVRQIESKALRRLRYIMHQRNQIEASA